MVRWNKYKVLRDLIQNFYDAVPRQDWEKSFSYEVRDHTLYLKASNVGFSYDWLIHIGASTKRGGDREYAGYFGEGFKIASLCATRDHDWQVEMRSRSWSLRVITSHLEVDHRPLKSLAYHVWRDESESPDTLLCLYPFFDEKLLETVVLSFYSPNNALFGEKIWESAEGAIYTRSKKPKPFGYPVTSDDVGPGIVFAGYQALGSFRHPLIFCLHRSRHNDRERNSFYRMHVVDLIQDTVRKLPAEPSARVLQLLKVRWYERPRKEYDFDCWYGIIRTLVRNVSRDPKQKELWRAEHPHLLVAEQVKKRDLPRYNRRRQALDWVKDHKQYRLVQDGFLCLDYPTLEAACESADGFSVTRAPSPLEARYIALLEELVGHLFKELFHQIPLPPCKVIKSHRAAWQGMTTCVAPKESPGHFRGLKIRFHLPYVALKSFLLGPEWFGHALSTYLHELAHMFGGDASASFSRALSEIMEVTLTHSVVVGQWQEKWTRLSEDLATK